MTLFNLLFLKEDKLLEGLKTSLSPYDDIVDVSVCYEPIIKTFMGSGCAVLNITDNDQGLLKLTHYLPWHGSEEDGFYAVWQNMPSYCRYCHESGHVVRECTKRRG